MSTLNVDVNINTTLIVSDVKMTKLTYYFKKHNLAISRIAIFPFYQHTHTFALMISNIDDQIFVSLRQMSA